MAKQWDAEVTIKCGTEIDMNELRKSFLNAQTIADKNAIVVNLTGDPKELEKTITEIQKKNPELVTSLNIKFDNNKLNEMSGLLSKAIGRRMSTGNEISNALRQQVESGIGDSKVNEYLSSVIKKAFGDKAKVTSGNVKSWLDPIKEELAKFNPEELVSMNSVSAMEKIIDLAQKIAQVQKIFNTTRNERIDLGIDKALDSNKLEFKYSDFKKQISDFYGNAGNFILSNIQKLNTDVSAAYKEFKGNWLQGITDVLSHNGNPQLNYTIGDADEIIKKLDTQIEALTTQIKEKFETAKTEIEKTLSNGYDGNKRTADNLAKNLALYKIDNGGQDYEVKSKSEEKTLNSFKKDIVNERGIASEVAKEIEGLNNQLAALIRQREIQAKYYSSINAEIGSQVASQLNSSMDTVSSGKGIGVAAEPVIDPTAFIAKIEEQLVNQAVKVIIEPTIKSLAEFEQLLQQQLPNEFINVQLKLDEKSAEVPVTPTISDPAAFAQKVNEIIAGYPAGINIDPIVKDIVAFQEDIKKQVGIIPISVSPTVDSAAKEGLKETTALDFSGILTDLDNLKSKVIDFKKEIDTLQESAKNALTTTSSLFEQFSAQPASDSGKITSVIESLKALSGTVNQDIDVEKTGHFVQALNEIGKLQVNPNVDLSNFKLGKLNSYLEKSEQLVHLGAALESLATGLDSLNIALTGANFEALKGVSISDKTIENLPKFAAGITQLKDELDKFSSSATGVLSSISQIVSKAQSLEYLYKLATAPNSNAQSNIIGNGLMSAFDKSAISSIQHPAGSTDEVAALAKEYQWLTSQARTYFELSSKFAKGTINSNDAAKLMQLQRAMEGATQRMNQFQETDQSLITAQNDLSTALSQNGTAIETALVNNLNKAIDKIDETQAEALGFKDALDAVKAKVTDIQNAFSSNGLISSKEIENAEAVLKKALEDAKQLKADISAAQKKQDTEIKNSYKNILENYSLSALSKAGTNHPENSVEVRKLANEYDYLNQMVGKYIQLLKEDASSKSVNSERISKIQALTQAYEAFISRQKAGVDTDALLQNSVSNLNASLSGMAKTLSGELTATLGSYIAKITDIKDGTTKYAASIEKMKQAQATISSQLGDNTADFATLKNALDTYASGLNAYKSVLADVAASERDATEAEKQALALDIQKWMNKNTKAAAKYKEELAALLDQLTKVTDRSGLEAVQTSYLKLQNQAEKLKETGSAFGDVMKAKFKELSTYLMSFASFYQVVNILKQGISIAHEYDDAFTEMRKVTDASTSSLKEFQKESFQLANQVGTTAEQLQQSTADWLRLGESFDEAKKSAQVSNVLLNVSEFENIDSATESLVAMSQAYQDLDKMDIVDKLNNVG